MPVAGEGRGALEVVREDVWIESKGEDLGQIPRSDSAWGWTQERVAKEDTTTSLVLSHDGQTNRSRWPTCPLWQPAKTWPTFSHQIPRPLGLEIRMVGELEGQGWWVYVRMDGGPSQEGGRG